MNNRISPYLPAALKPAPPAEDAWHFNEVDLLIIKEAVAAMKAKYPGCSAGKALTEICAEFAERERAK